MFDFQNEILKKKLKNVEKIIQKINYKIVRI